MPLLILLVTCGSLTRKLKNPLRALSPGRVIWQINEYLSTSMQVALFFWYHVKRWAPQTSFTLYKSWLNSEYNKGFGFWLKLEYNHSNLLGIRSLNSS